MPTNEAKVAACESIIGYVFENKLLYLEALQTSGHLLRWHHDLIRVERNDRLAVFGDSMAKAFLCKQWLDTGRNKGGRYSPPFTQLLCTPNIEKRPMDPGRASFANELEFERGRLRAQSGRLCHPEHGHATRVPKDHGYYG